MRRKRSSPAGAHAVARRGPVRTVLLSLCAVLFAMVPVRAAYAERGELFAAVNGDVGNYAGSIYKYSSGGAQSTFASGLSRPRGIAFDSERNLFMASNFCNGRVCDATILTITPDGEQSVFGAVRGHFAQGMAIDQLDNVFVVADNTGNAESVIFSFTPDGRRKMFGMFRGQAMGLAFDASGNLFAASPSNATIYKFTPDGTRSVFVGPEAFTSDESGPQGLAFDRLGDLFVSVTVFPFTNNRIIKFDPRGAKSTFATGLKKPRGLVFDDVGDLYVAEWPDSEPGNIRRFTADGASTLFASGIGSSRSGGPTWLAIKP